MGRQLTGRNGGPFAVRNWIVAFACVAASLLSVPLQAANFRWAGDGEVATVDPYARNETFLLSFLGNVYEPLIRRGARLELEPALATAWQQTAPDTWRFALRRKVRFHDGSPLTADDVVFSFERARQPGSMIANKLSSIVEVRKIDDFTVDVMTDGTDPILPEKITLWYIMDREWWIRHGGKKVDGEWRADDVVNHLANGTGPFVLAPRNADDPWKLTAFGKWWDARNHSVDSATYRHIADPVERIAALIADEVDLVYPVPLDAMERLAAAPAIRTIEGPELRTIFLGFDMSREELVDSSVKGRNPFKDIRVRRAFYLAIDEQAVAARVMRGAAIPAGLIIAPGVNGFDASLNKREAYDPDAARKLLAEAGFPNGFALTMDCPSDRYVNDVKICEAIAGMLDRVGVKVLLRKSTRAKYLARLLGPNFNSSFYLLGWTPATYDAHQALFNLIASRGVIAGQGLYNIGGFSDPTLDDLIQRMQVEPDPVERNALIRDALIRHKASFAHIPLHQQSLIWAVRKGIDLVQPADNFFSLRYVTVK